MTKTPRPVARSICRRCENVHERPIPSRHDRHSQGVRATSALRGVDLDLRPGEVHALVGENGAGKSTLMKILSGAVAADAGNMTLDGEPFPRAIPKTPAAAA